MLNQKITMHVPGRRIHKSTASLWTLLTLLFVALAATLQVAGAQSVDTTEAQPEIFVCSGICEDDEGVLEFPDKVIEYQWNRRVPVCSGLSCDEASCADLETKLGQLQLSEFECERHKYELQRNGCSCTEAEPLPPPTTPPQITGVNESKNIAVDPEGTMTPSMKWGVVATASVVVLMIVLVLYIGVKHDDKLQAKKAQGERPESQEEGSFAEA